MRKGSSSILGAVLLAIGLGLVGYTIYSWFSPAVDPSSDSTAYETQPSLDANMGGTGFEPLNSLAANSTSTLLTPGGSETPASSNSSPVPSATYAQADQAPTLISPAQDAPALDGAIPMQPSQPYGMPPAPPTDPLKPAQPATPLPLNPLELPTATTTQPANPMDSSTPAASQPGTLDLLPPIVIPDALVTTPTQPDTHTIVSGDTLGSLAKKYLGKESRWPEIAQLNPNLDPTNLKIGQVVKLPATATHSSSSTYSSNPLDPPSEISMPSNAQSHTVREGDTFWTIAEQYYGSGAHWQSIYRANRQVVGANPDRLSTGMKLIIPPKPAD